MHRALRTACLLLLLASSPALADDAPAPKAGDVAEKATERKAPVKAKAQPVTAEERDAALKLAMRYLDRHLVRGSSGAGPRRYAMAIAGWAYLMAEDDESARLPPRRHALIAIRKRLREIGRMGHRTWEVAAGVQFLAESVARGKRSGRDARLLRRYLDTLELWQQSCGGWIHDISPTLLRGSYARTLTAASCQALAAVVVGRRTLGRDPSPGVPRALAYLETTQHDDGSFAYDPSRRRREADAAKDGSDAQPKAKADGGALPSDLLPPRYTGIDVARTGGVVFALLCSKMPAETPMLARAMEVIDRAPQYLSEGHGSASMSLLYGAMAAKLRGAKAWQTFRERFYRRILRHQEKDGRFTCICTCHDPVTTCDSHTGLLKYVDSSYITALMTMVLMLDRGALRAIEAARR